MSTYHEKYSNCMSLLFFYRERFITYSSISNFRREVKRICTLVKTFSKQIFPDAKLNCLLIESPDYRVG